MRYSDTISARFTGKHRFCISLLDSKEDTVLDVGCWIGWLEAHIRDRCRLIVGIDTNKEALRNAKKNVVGEFICASAANLPFQNNVFTKVTMFDVIEHLSREPINLEYRCLTDINRVLKVNGDLVISTPNKNLLSIFLDPAYFLRAHRHYSYLELKTILEARGFEIKENKYGGGIVESLSVLLLYVFKHLFNSEISFKNRIEYAREKEYQGEGFQTLFVKAREVRKIEF
jgi:ubiquinone/menaquinone biosynthesis C-methylase UbiE